MHQFTNLMNLFTNLIHQLNKLMHQINKLMHQISKLMHPITNLIYQFNNHETMKSQGLGAISETWADGGEPSCQNSFPGSRDTF